MYNLLIFLAIALIGIILYLTITKRKPWKFIAIIMVIIIGALLLIGFRFTASSALPNGTKPIESIETIYGQAILYEDVNNHTFGLAKIHRSMGFLYHYAGGAPDYILEVNEPFQAAGFGSDEQDGFMVGIKTGNPNIKYIVVGNHLENLTPSEPYNFNMETVENYPNSYHVKEIVDNHAFFVLDEYSEKTWTIRALDKDGNLIADKLFGTGEARYTEW
ncbi:hypothetical protein J416_04411 [Gracilibacillus halophilus YIM-C55.5]|uniref:Uncharacterized protein n=1 Tax=Gracilibacillus halophilus YIM-C55.5 TaxID=1308866 RepID=N4WBJ3_9BACI|nr:hypothetical protein [Gracilibacillus halophilus]ENH97658.1 hypothetical protein J416_04411 [Gracilibacillus halophilus YIM-C55.5]